MIRPTRAFCLRAVYGSGVPRYGQAHWPHNRHSRGRGLRLGAAIFLNWETVLLEWGLSADFPHPIVSR